MSLLMIIDLQRPDFHLCINAELETSGFSAIYGHSGAGKTTLLRWLAGLEKNTPGQLTFNGQIWQDKTTFIPTHQRQIAYVFQDARLFPHLNVKGNLAFAYQRRFNNDGPTVAQVCEWFELTPLLHVDSAHLSGGQQQRVAIARALLSSPRLILMDEPLGSLDAQSKQRILPHLETLRRQKIPVIYVSHDLEEISRLAEQAIILENGRICAQGSLLELSSRLDLNLNHQENAASIIEACVHQHDPHYQLTELKIDNQLPLYLTKTDNAAGDKLRVRIPARDVSITLDKAKDSSILNILPGTIDEIENTTDARVLLRIKIAKQFLLVRLTHKSIDRLKLKKGQSVYAQIKTVALLNRHSQQ